MVIWKETEHDIDEIRAGNDVGTVVSLCGYGLLKLFNIPNMRSRVKLLEYILRIWNLEQLYFEVGAHIMTMEVEDIYFLNYLTRRGEPILLTGPRGGEITT